MKLSEEQSRRLLHAHGIHVTEACDRCTRLLGPVRWTTRSLPGFRMRPLGWDNVCWTSTGLVNRSQSQETQYCRCPGVIRVILYPFQVLGGPVAT